MTSKNVYVPKRYIPKRLSKKDRKQQRNQLKKSRKLYKKGKYHTRKKVKSFKSKTSNHITNAKRIYKMDAIVVDDILAEKTGCDLIGLEKIVSKGRGAYFSSGSRPNQTSESWGIARLASSITGGKSSQQDFKILEQYCHPKKSKALQLAKKTRKTSGKSYGTRKVPKVKL